jgi:ParB family chromosome partitioning protein
MATKKDMSVKMVDGGVLTPHPRNSRIHSAAQIQQICDSIEEFGFTNPLLVDENNVVLAGHGRLQAGQSMGMTKFPVVQITHLTEAQKRAYIIADNKLALNSGWDEKMLAEELGNLTSEDFSLEVTGFDIRELGAMNLFGGSDVGDLVNLNRPDSGSAGSIGALLSWSTYRLAMSDDEQRQLEAALKEYEDQFGLHQGFVAWLCEGRGIE